LFRFLVNVATLASLHNEFRFDATTIGSAVTETVWDILQPVYAESENSTEEWKEIA
jgi:hypothetical protein